MLSLAGLPSMAAAQSVQIPRSVQAGTVEEMLRAPPMPAPPLITEKEYRPLKAPPGADKAYFLLRNVKIEGVRAYASDRFKPFYADMLGKKVSLADMYALADRIRRVYHDDGYVLTQVFLPPQKISEGVIRIHVTEGYISHIRWQGKLPNEALMKAMAGRITDMRPFDSKILEDVMLRMNELPGISATAALEPLPAANAPEGAVGLAITVERRRVAGSVSVDDYASRYLGVWQTTGKADAFGLLTGLDHLNITGSSSADPSQMRYGALQYSLPVSPSGTTVSVGASLSATHPGYRLASLDIFSRAQNFNAGISQPLLRSRVQSLDVSGQFAILNQQTNVLGQRFSTDRLRTVTASAVYSLADGWAGANLLDVDLVRGLNILDPTETGSPMLSRANGRSDFTKVDFTASRLQTINDDFSLFVAATGQKASASLLSAEQFGFGGASFGRAYDPSEISGDDGIAASVELRWQAVSENWALQPFVFYDIGMVENKEPGAQSISAADAGFGVRAAWRAWHADANLAFPLTYTPAAAKLGERGNDPRFNLSVGTTF